MLLSAAPEDLVMTPYSERVSVICSLTPVMMSLLQTNVTKMQKPYKLKEKIKPRLNFKLCNIKD